MCLTPTLPKQWLNKLIARSPGRGLTGNLKNPALNAEGKDDGNHVRIFTAAKIASDETAALNRAGFILIGLLSGGDYEEVGLQIGLCPDVVLVLITYDWRSETSTRL